MSIWPVRSPGRPPFGISPISAVNALYTYALLLPVAFWVVYRILLFPLLGEARYGYIA
jgi:hypothetical protein